MANFNLKKSDISESSIKEFLIKFCLVNSYELTVLSGGFYSKGCILKKTPLETFFIRGKKKNNSIQITVNGTFGVNKRVKIIGLTFTLVLIFFGFVFFRPIIWLSGGALLIHWLIKWRPIEKEIANQFKKEFEG